MNAAGLLPTIDALRGAVQRRAIAFRLRWIYLVGLVGAVYSVLTLVLTPPAFGVNLALGLLFTFAGVIALAKSTSDVWRENRALYLVDTQLPGELELSDLYANFEQVSFHGSTAAIYSDELNDLLFPGRIGVELVPEPYALPNDVRELRPCLLWHHHRLGKLTYNSEKVRLASDLTPKSVLANEPIRLQPTDYFSGLCTNEVALAEVGVSGEDTVRLDGRNLFINNGILGDLAGSKCSNHIGISTLALASDGHLVITVQAERSAQSPRLLAPSGAGSADLGDLGETDDLASFLSRAMEREFVEECGFDPSSPPPMKTIVVGYARLLTRGGKPEFFGLSIIDAAARTSIARKEQVYIADIRTARMARQTASEFRLSLQRYRAENGARFSLPLELAMGFVEQFLDRHPDRLAALVEGISALNRT